MTSDQSPAQRSHYGKLEYWERRYSENTKQFDWYQDFNGVKDIITQYINHKSKLLYIGCGNSRLGEDMYREGYTNITNIDFSETVIEQQKIRYKDMGETFKFEIADARYMPTFQNEEFDCVIDKGTLDSVLCGEYSSQNSKKLLTNVHRVLSEKGVYIIISYGQPKFRLHYLEQKDLFDWSVTHYKVYKPDVASNSLEFNINDPDSYHYIYVCKRGALNMAPGMQVFSKQ